MALCCGCGNEVLDPDNCPICKAGRASKSVRKKVQDQQQQQQQAEQDNRCRCPRCNEPLEQQNWEGTVTLACSSCRGTLFPGRALEEVLDKLRASVDPVDAETVMQAFKDRFTRQLPETIRYKACPVCDEVMQRRAYGTVSGVITDYCPDHGTWIDESQFAALADFICRGGDVLASEVGKVRDRITSRGPKSGPSLLDRFLGNG